MTHPVVVGIDGSPESLAAADWAAGEAALRHAPLRLLHAWEWTVPPAGTNAVKEDRRAEAMRLVTEVEQRLARSHPGLSLSGEQVEGRPSDVLLAASQEPGTLVLGSRGMGRIAGFLVGSVAFRVVGHTHRPLVLVRAARSGAADRHAADAEVVAGIDLAHRCDEVLAHAFEAARLRARGLHVVNAYVPPALYGVASSVSLTGVGQTPAEREAELEAELLPWRTKYPDVPVRATSASGSAAPCLADAAEYAPLLVIGRREPEARLGPTLGSVAYAILHHADCPVAVIPHG